MQLAGELSPGRGVPMERSGVLEPYSHAPWEASQPVPRYRHLDQFWQAVPGLSQIWKRRQGLVYGQREGTPDCLLVLDSSGSMPTRAPTSLAVLGAACAAEAYLRHAARVAVYNFSDALMGGKTVVPFTPTARPSMRAYVSTTVAAPHCVCGTSMSCASRCHVPP